VALAGLDKTNPFRRARQPLLMKISGLALLAKPLPMNSFGLAAWLNQSD
jgi:hypothetical protein